ncbi:MAG TPA: hypothetical protein VMQ56_00055 [Terracidiphilus sp.]|nr:hypothetical protein [Terracidiphilus sp.]
MRRQMLAAAVFVVLASGRAPAQTLTAVETDWNATFVALERGDAEEAKAAFGRFNLALRSYSSTNRIDWRTEYLAGSLDCQFAETRDLGAQVLNDILQNNRALNAQGNAELSRVLKACQAPVQSRDASVGAPPIPANLLDASAHFTQPGVRGNTKSGDSYTPPKEFQSAVTTVSSAELEARRVAISSPQVALDDALKSIGQPSAGTTRDGFAVVELGGTSRDAAGVADCLARYAAPMKAEFQIEPSRYMLTVYVVPSRVEVYEMARRLHGLVLPPGVLAYSVPEDMSLTSQGGLLDCGSMAHEMVHLLIKDRFPGAPAWLEEGLASEVAIAEPTPERFVFGWSWRDRVLFPDPNGRPTINELLNMSWTDFSQNPDYPASYIQATAAVFVRYLDQRGKLQPVYFAVRDHHLTADLAAYRSYREILEDVFHAPISTLQADFNAWFAQQYGVNRQPRTVGSHIN